MAAKADEGKIWGDRQLQGARWEGGSGSGGGEPTNPVTAGKPAANDWNWNVSAPREGVIVIRWPCIGRSGDGLAAVGCTQAPCQPTIRVFGMWVAWDKQKATTEGKSSARWMDETREKDEGAGGTRPVRTCRGLPEERGGFPGRPSLNVLG